jgi:RNA polymerase sigma-70 factor (sigma-E family)
MSCERMSGSSGWTAVVGWGIESGLADDFASSDRDQLAAVFSAHYEPLVRVARLLGAEADAEDLVQTAFYRLQQRGELRDPSMTAAYLRRTVVNLLRSRWRHALSVRRHAWVHRSEAIDDADITTMIVVRSALRELPRRQREAVTLRYLLDLSEAQTAEAMGVSVGTVKSSTSRGLAALKVTLSRTAL